jgi:hypothetical protein
VPLNCGIGRNRRKRWTVGPFSVVASGSVIKP